MSNPMFSIVIPCYNGFDYLEKLLEKLILVNGSLDAGFCEVIIVDDGSDCDFVFDLPDNFYLYKKCNGGVSSARNYGLKKAIGEYVVFLDCDDDIKVNFLKEININLKSKCLDVAIFSYVISKNNVCKKVFNSFDGVFSGHYCLSNVLSKRLRFHICSMVFRRDFMIKSSLFFNEDLSYFEDVLFGLKALKNSENVGVFDYSFFTYVSNDGSAVNQRFDSRFLSQIESFDEIKSELEPVFKDNLHIYFLYTCALHSVIRAVSSRDFEPVVLHEFLLYLKELPGFSVPFLDKYGFSVVLSRFFLLIPLGVIDKISCWFEK